LVTKTAKNSALENDTKESSVEDFLSLLKPRVMSLAIFTSICGLFLAPIQMHPFFIFLSILCISIGAGASGAINMWYDQDIDGLMVRTQGRPIPQGKISALDALGFGVILALVSVLILGLAVNYFAAFLLFFSIFFYVFIYTIWLKRRTPQNIVIGGAAGAFPPVIGWACSTGDVSTFPLILFLIIFMWTPPHFWALALYKDIEYSKAKVPMLPVVKGKKTTKRQIMIYSIILFAVTILPFLFGFSGLLYLISALALNSYFCYLAFRLFKSKEDDKLLYAPKLFKFSILYLYSVFSFLVIDMAL